MAAIKEAGDSALLLELEPVIGAAVNARAVAIAAAVREDLIAGVRDVISTYRSVAVHFDPLIADAREIHASLERASGATGKGSVGRLVEIPVEYGEQWGPDLADVAAFARDSTEGVVRKHTERDYRVFMLGFLPGFAYLGPVDPAIAAPRRPSPRERVRAGSVGIAGGQTAVYPLDSPGGWQIIGHTPMRLFDVDQQPAAVLAPGDSVRFRNEPRVSQQRTALTRPVVQLTNAARSMMVIEPGLFTTVQDSGRWGHQVSGVPVSGAMDWVAHRTANALVGNEPSAATLEATLVGPKLRFEQRTTIAVTGADLGAMLDGARVPLCAAVSCPAGGILRFSNRSSGARAYVAADGGIEVPRVLSSRSTHVLSRMGGAGGRALLQGDRLGLGTPRSSGGRRRPVEAKSAVQGGGARLRVIPGPQREFFPDDAMEGLERSRFVVSPQSNRMGYRLQGPPIPRLPEREMISDAAFTGAIQVPGSGEPILLMSDRQTTGGYPQLAVVITADIPLAGQLAPGDWVEFRVCSRAEALTALVAQEARLLAFD
ncbi:MAG TPA: 5-oxoprolinase subunit PxpB [Vicinamibacterales bacterium]|nr:5-oxoprolinase subunit PxpB [Vicinamibacterales bacterium]